MKASTWRPSAPARSAWSASPSDAYDVIVLDVWLPGIDGLATLQRLGERQVDAQVVIISGHGNIESAVRAIKMGAFDFIEKPLSLEKTMLVVRNALRQRDLEAENRALRARVDRQFTMVGDSPAMRHLREQVAMAAPTNGRVLILGENGTGKELVARTIHAAEPTPAGSLRRGQLRGDSRGADRDRIVRPREGRLHGRGRRQTGSVRAGHWRHDLPGRDRRHEPEDAGQGAARAAGAGDGAGGRHPAHQGRCARPGGHQQGPAVGDSRGPFSRGPLLPAERDPDSRAAAPRSPGRHRRACRSLHGDAGGGVREAAEAAGAGGRQPSPAVPLARERARTAQHDRAPGHHGGRGHDHGRRTWRSSDATARLRSSRRPSSPAGWQRRATSSRRTTSCGRWPHVRATCPGPPRCWAWSVRISTRR